MEGRQTPAQVYERVFVPAMFQPCTELLLALAPPRAGARVLDVACGTGVVARAVAPLVGASGHVTALDLRPPMLAVASALAAPAGATIEWVEGDATDLPVSDGSFDLVLCQQGLQFFTDPAAAMSEMRRSLVAGGQVGVAVWQGLDANTFFSEMTDIELRHLAAVGMTREDLAVPFLRGDPEWLRGLFAQAAFGDGHVEQRQFEARFPAEGFVENVEFAYSAVVPEFMEDPAAFRAFVEAVGRDIDDLLARHRQGDAITFPLHVNIGVARAA